jgi:glutamine amidotransferase
MIGIIDFGSGNLAALANLMKSENIEYRIVNTVEGLYKSDRYILPGVGNFDTTIEMLRKQKFFSEFEGLVTENGRALLGICVGMQMLADSSEEGDAKGLGWIGGEVMKFSSQDGKRVPHVGWNSLKPLDPGHPLLAGIDCEQGFYFLHSYFYKVKSSGNTIALTDYFIDFSSVISNGANVYGVQFHPEKSHRNGALLLKNFSVI